MALPLTPETCARLDAAGLDLRAPLRHDGAPAVLVGNSRAVWGPFLDWLRAEPARLERPHPFDGYAAASLAAALAATPHAPHRIVAPTDRLAPDFVGLAVAAGLYWRGPGGLGIHPVFGPWTALRALVVFGADAPAPASGDAPAPPCSQCDHACRPAWEALRRPATEAEYRSGDAWRAFAAARAACPTGREHAYSPEQIRYHATHDREVLRRLIGAPRGTPREHT